MNSTEPTQEGFKLFVGNLNFSTTEQALIDYFSRFGKVVGTNLITPSGRGRRHNKGYGFIIFENENEAKEAVNRTNATELDGRAINVEFARPQDPNAPRYPPRGRGRGGRGGRGGGRGGYRRGLYDNHGGRPRRGGYRGQRIRTEPEGEPSEKAIFVANLPYRIEQEALLKLFSEYAPIRAHVVVSRSGYSQGFGFVEFTTKEGQQKAIADNEKIESESRKLTIRIAKGDPFERAKDQQNKKE